MSEDKELTEAELIVNAIKEFNTELNALSKIIAEYMERIDDLDKVQKIINTQSKVFFCSGVICGMLLKSSGEKNEG